VQRSLDPHELCAARSEATRQHLDFTGSRAWELHLDLAVHPLVPERIHPWLGPPLTDLLIHDLVPGDPPKAYERGVLQRLPMTGQNIRLLDRTPQMEERVQHDLRGREDLARNRLIVGPDARCWVGVGHRHGVGDEQHEAGAQRHKAGSDQGWMEDTRSSNRGVENAHAMQRQNGAQQNKGNDTESNHTS
jgi:hypothetical protein